MDTKEKLCAAVEKALELFWARQVICLGCGDRSGADEEYLCVRCAHRLEEIRAATQQRCLGCGNPAEARCICKRMPHVEAARYAFYYQLPADGIVQHFKYSGIRCAAEWMSEQMYNVLLHEDWLEEVDALVPVPMPAKRLRKRGYNQAALLAEELSKQTELPVLPLLERVGETRQQVRLSHKERVENVKGAFRALADAKGLRLLLIDDVRTTGATLEACAKTLRTAGAGEVRALTFAAVSRRVEG